jgi:hypothetical protein
MHPRDYCPHYCENGNKKQYQLVIMHEDGMTYCVGRIYDWNEVQKAAKEIRELYAKHGVTHHVGFREV